MPTENENLVQDDAVDVRVEGEAPDPHAPIINGGDGARAENERTRSPSTDARDAPRRERDTSRRVEDDGDEAYSAQVRRRISKEVAKRHDAERRAQHLEAELHRVSGEARNASEASLVHYEQAALAKLDAAKREAAEAYDSGDSAKVVEANRKLASAQMAVDNVESVKAKRELEKPDPTRQEQPRPQQQQQSRFTPRTQEWVDENPWFEEDPDARTQAIKIHDRLKREGYEIESPEYFEELTRRSRVLFPEHFEGDGGGRQQRRRADDSDDEGETGAKPKPARSQPNVAAVARTPSTPAQGRRVQPVKLSAAEFEAASIAGVSAKAYAESLLKLRAAGKVK